MRKVNTVLRGDRISAVTIENSDIIVSFGAGKKAMKFCKSQQVFIHCSSPGPFNGNGVDRLFPSKNLLQLFMLFAPPFPLSMSCLAKLEARRSDGSLV